MGHVNSIIKQYRRLEIVKTLTLLRHVCIFSFDTFFQR